jgi:hypothetical protein
LLIIPKELARAVLVPAKRGDRVNRQTISGSGCNSMPKRSDKPDWKT